MQSLQMYPLAMEEWDFDALVSPLTPDLWSGQILLPGAQQHGRLNQVYESWVKPCFSQLTRVSVQTTEGVCCGDGSLSQAGLFQTGEQSGIRHSAAFLDEAAVKWGADCREGEGFPRRGSLAQRQRQATRTGLLFFTPLCPESTGR